MKHFIGAFVAFILGLYSVGAEARLIITADKPSFSPSERSDLTTSSGAHTASESVSINGIGQNVVAGGALFNIFSVGDVNVMAETVPAISGNRAVSSSADSHAYGGAIFNTGTINSIVARLISGNGAESTAGDNAYGGAIFNTGTIGVISASFTGNEVKTTTGMARGGAIYTTEGLVFLADTTDLNFAGNKAIEAVRGTYSNAIYFADGGTSTRRLFFDVRNGLKINFDDQIEGESAFDINIYGGGTIQFNNQVIKAENVSVAGSTLILGGSSSVKGLFFEDFDSQGAPMTNLNLNNSDLQLTYASTTTLQLASLSMANGSRIDTGANHTISANEFRFNGANSITNTVAMNFDDADLYFVVPSGIRTTQSLLGISGGVSIDNANINIHIDTGVNLVVGNRINLIEAGTLDSGDVFNFDPAANLTQGTGMLYEVDLGIDNNNLVMTVTRGNLNPQTKTYAEGNIAGAAFLNQGADLIANGGIVGQVKSPRRPNNRSVWFTAASGGKSTYETGSSADVTGLSMISGFATRITRKTLGVFAEYGIAQYGTKNDFGLLGSVEADGDVNYVGGGVMYSQRFTNGANFTMSARAGMINNKFGTDDFISLAPNESATFEASTFYYGGHIGIGYVTQLQRVFSELDSSVKYFVTMMQGYETEVAPTGEKIEFDNIFSQRFRVGTRLTMGTSVHRPYTVPGKGIVINKLTIGDAVVRPYVGAHAEYEFDTRANATMYERHLETPMISGISGIAELGLAIENERLLLVLGGEGYIGNRQGFGGMMQFKYRFSM